jgi:hypothetical protein
MNASSKLYCTPFRVGDASALQDAGHCGNNFYENIENAKGGVWTLYQRMFMSKK